jgi:hypothetical protein
MPFLISDSNFEETPREGVPGPVGHHGDVGILLETLGLLNLPFDQGEVAAKGGIGDHHMAGVGSGSDAGNSSGTDPSTGLRLDDEGNAVECDGRAISQRSTATGTSNSTRSRSGASSSGSSRDNDAESDPQRRPVRRSGKSRENEPTSGGRKASAGDGAGGGAPRTTVVAGKPGAAAPEGFDFGDALNAKLNKWVDDGAKHEEIRTKVSRRPSNSGGAKLGRSTAASTTKTGASNARGSAGDFSRKFALAKEIARNLSGFDHGCFLHEVQISPSGVDTLESLNLILKDFITTHPQTQFFKVDAHDGGVMVRLKKGGWVLSQEDGPSAPLH